jgi:tetratricopeptide (TPR) repeat protein
MDCRKLLPLALWLAAGVAGCTPVAGLRPPGPPGAGKGEELTHKASTYVAFGDYRAASGFGAECSAQQQTQYREEARRAYLKAIEVDPKYLPAYLSLARLQAGCEDHAGAASIYERALKLNDRDASMWFEAGMCQCRLKNWNPAVEGLRKACELDPKNRQYGRTLGFALARAGRYEESFQVLAHHSGEAKAHLDLARMLRHQKQDAAARQQVLLALRMDPSLTGARALLGELGGLIPPPPEVQAVSYTTAQAPSPKPAPPPARQETVVNRPIPLPPLPVISIRSEH